MKKSINITALLLSAMLLTAFLVSCGKINTEALWSTAMYKEDTAIGSGEKTVRVEICAGEKSIVLTVKTDKATLGEALFENGLVNDAEFFDTCNGIRADWSKSRAYWSFYVNGAVAEYGIGSESAVTDSDNIYRIEYTA